MRSYRESNLWADFLKLCPQAVRIENSIASGTPDVLFPTETGWRWLELKIQYDLFFYMRPFQLSFAIKTMRMENPALVPYYIIYERDSKTAQVFNAGVLVGLRRFSARQKKVQVQVDFSIPYRSLSEIIVQLGALG